MNYKRVDYYDGYKLWLMLLFKDGSYLIRQRGGKTAEMGDAMFLMSDWAKHILKRGTAHEL